MSEHERPNFPFADLHREGDSVSAVLLHDHTVEGLDMALYLDGSQSMADEYEYKSEGSSGGLFAWLFGRKKKEEQPKANVVEPQARWILDYLATKDRNGQLGMACGDGGREIGVIGELKGADVASFAFPGPVRFGGGTNHEEHEGVGHLWCHRIADEMEEMAELVAGLVDETMTVAAGGVVYDDKGNVLKRYEAKLPAVLQFEVPESCTAFVLEIAGKRFEQPLPPPHDDDDHHHD